MRISICLALAVGLSGGASAGLAAGRPDSESSSPYVRWSHGPPPSADYFPIAVWLQNPSRAAQFKAAGINLYVGLWKGPTTNQLAQLRAAGMPVICSQNEISLAHRDDPIIIGWMHGDEPDNAQGIPGLRRYGPPILPERIIADYETMRTQDPTRPVMINLGQGVAYDNYIGRGVRRNHPEDYLQYLKGCDIASFDIYPVVHDTPEIAGKLEYVGRGVERLVQWSGGQKVVWNCIECTHISNPLKKATPDQVRSEVWMALIRGSKGLIYFIHQFEPQFVEAALLSDPVLLPAITEINRQIHDLAPVLNAPDVAGGVRVEVMDEAGAAGESSSVAWMRKLYRGSNYLFSVNMTSHPIGAAFTLAAVSGDQEAEVLGESRRVPLENGRLRDSFGPYQVHLYSLAPHQ